MFSNRLPRHRNIQPSETFTEKQSLSSTGLENRRVLGNRLPASDNLPNSQAARPKPRKTPIENSLRKQLLKDSLSGSTELSLDLSVDASTENFHPSWAAKRSTKIETAMQSIEHMVEGAEHMELSEVEKTISHSFVLDRHIKAIGLMAKKLNFAVSVRDSGPSTLRCLALGAAAKGHDILEKTIKKSSVEGAYPDRADAIMDKLTASHIDGYVGRWSKEGGLIGVYMGPEARNHPELAKKLVQVRSDASDDPVVNDYYPIDVENLEASLQTLQAIPQWQSLPFTGDYDLHDMLNFSGQRGSVPQASPHEQKILKAINAAVYVVDKSTRPMDLTHKNVVRHGPQYNYFSHMRSTEPEAKVLGVVAKPSFPIAMCNRGEWTIIQSIDELKGFYSDNSVKLKTSWSDAENYYENQKAGEVTRRR